MICLGFFPWTLCADKIKILIEFNLSFGRFKQVSNKRHFCWLFKQATQICSVCYGETSISVLLKMIFSGNLMFNSVIFHNFKWCENKCHPAIHVSTDDDLPPESVFDDVEVW